MTIFDKTLTANSGCKIPRMALGVWEIPKKATAKAVTQAIRMGYRHIDTAQAYGNEAEVAEGVKNSGISRYKVFINSKIEAGIKNYQQAKKSIDDTLDRMGLNYLDMMIIHNPQPWNEVNQSNDRHFEGNLETWRAMEDAVKAGKLMAIGVSSFQKEDLDNLIKNSDTKPAVNQILVHIGHTPSELIKYNQDQGIIVEAFSPIAHGAAMKVPEIKKIAARYGVSVPQLCIRYDWQLGLVVIAKSTNPVHMKSNSEIDFKISKQDMTTLKGIKSIDYGEAKKFPVYGGKI